MDGKKEALDFQLTLYRSCETFVVKGAAQDVRTQTQNHCLLPVALRPYNVCHTMNVVLNSTMCK